MATIARFRDPVNLSAQLRAANERLLTMRQQRTPRVTDQEIHSAQECAAQHAVQHAVSINTAPQVATLRTRPPVQPSPQNQRPRQPISLDILPDAPCVVTQKRTTIRVQPTLLAAMLREEMAAIGRIWLLCRHLDAQGRGWLDVTEVRTALTDKASPLRVCGWRRLRQLLQAGKGVLWERDDCGRLWLYGTTRVAANLDLAYLQGSAVELPIADLLQTIGGVRASFYACFHAGREALPISRDSLQTITGVAPRTQRDYDQQCEVARVTNFAILDTQDRELALWEHGRAAFAFTAPDGDRRLQWARRLPNSYLAPYETSATDGTKPLNRQLRRDLAKYGTQGNTSQSKRQERLYFTDGRHAAKQAHKQERLYLRERQKSCTVIWNGWHNTTNQRQEGDTKACDCIIQHS